MMREKLYLFGVLAILAFTVPSCDNGGSLVVVEDETSVDGDVDDTDNYDGDIFTGYYYVYYDVSRGFGKDEQCGHLLFEDRGNPGHFHVSFAWAKNLPKEYQEYLLPITVTFNYTGEAGEICAFPYPVINIVTIQETIKGDI